MRMHSPPHPGKLIRKECLDPLGLTVTAAARALGITRKALSALINGHSGISPEMAVRLSKAFGSEPETWLGMQMQYDLWQASRRVSRLKVKTLYGTHVGSVRVRRGVDLTQPVLDEEMDAESGREIRR
jgi:addiction module HigA family antidote